MNNFITLHWCNWHADNADFQTLIKADSLIRTNPLLFQPPKKSATIRATLVSVSSACHSEQHQKKTATIHVPSSKPPSNNFSSKIKITTSNYLILHLLFD